MNKEMLKIFLDGIVKKNPIIVLGLAISPVIVATGNLKSSIIMAIVTSITLVGIAVVTSLLRNSKISNKTRTIIIVAVSTIITLVSIKLVENEAPGIVVNLQFILPLTALESIILVFFDKTNDKPVIPAVAKALGQGAGFSLIICIVGLIREALTYGMIFGKKLPFDLKADVWATSFGGFIILGFTAAVINFIYNLIKSRKEKTEDKSV